MFVAIVQYMGVAIPFVYVACVVWEAIRESTIHAIILIAVRSFGTRPYSHETDAAYALNVLDVGLSPPPDWNLFVVDQPCWLLLFF